MNTCDTHRRKYRISRKGLFLNRKFRLEDRIFELFKIEKPDSRGERQLSAAFVRSLKYLNGKEI